MSNIFKLCHLFPMFETVVSMALILKVRSYYLVNIWCENGQLELKEKQTLYTPICISAFCLDKDFLNLRNTSQKQLKQNRIVCVKLWSRTGPLSLCFWYKHVFYFIQTFKSSKTFISSIKDNVMYLYMQCWHCA